MYTEEECLEAEDMFTYYFRAYQSDMEIGRQSEITKLWMRNNGYEGEKFRPDRDSVRLEVKKKLGLL